MTYPLESINVMHQPTHHPAPYWLQFERAPWRRVGLSKSTIYNLIATGEFPRPVRIGRAACFVPAEVDAWVAKKVAGRNAETGGNRDA